MGKRFERFGEVRIDYDTLCQLFISWDGISPTAKINPFRILQHFNLFGIDHRHFVKETYNVMERLAFLLF